MNTSEAIQTDLPDLDHQEPIDHPDEQPAPQNRIRRIGLTALAGAAVLLIAAAIALYLISRDSVRILDSVPIAAQDILQQPDLPALVAVDPEPVPEPPAADAALMQDEALRQVGQRMDSLTDKFEEAIRLQEDAHRYLDSRIEIVVGLKTDIDVIAQALNALSSEIAQLRYQQAEPIAEQTAQPATYPRSAEIPPFKLIAIDRWNSHWNAVIELDGQVAMIAPNDSRAGWQLVGLDPTARTALFRNVTGSDHELSVR